MRREQKGFTLIEILITVAAVAILAAIAIPQYTQYITRAAITEGHSALAGYRILMEQYYQDNRNYGGAGCGVAVPALKNFTQTCALTNVDQGYTATATGSGRASGFTFTITHLNARNTTAVPAGWTAPATPCFVTRSNGDC